ncbi:MAG: LamG domain-containing protein [Bacteroidetes bacterium]|nr:LamG domain-containing protein [Bacteroidota bacterium]
MKHYYNKILFISAILMTVIKINAQSIPELLYYKFDGVGTTVPNMASAPPIGTNTANILGGITQGGTGKCGGALIGSGISATTDYLNTGWATNLTGTSWTISFWSSNITPSGTLFYIFGDVNAGGFRCFTNGVAGPNNWILRGGFTDVLISGGATVAPHMNTFVYDMALGNIKAYLDGNLVNTVVQAGPTINGAGPFKVMGYSANIGAPVGGLLDDFRIYSHALNAGEVMNLYTSVSASATLTTVCAGNPTTLSATGASAYTWDPGIIPGNNIIVNPIATTTYTVTGNDAGCAATSTVNINVTPSPSVTASASPDNICIGGSSQLIGGGANTYTWNPGALAGSPTVTPGATTTYTVTGDDGSGCTATSMVTVTVNPASPSPNPVTATPSAICDGATSQLNSTGAPGNVQSWYTVPSGGVAIGTSLSGVDFPVTPAVTTTYYAENLAQVGASGTQTFSFTGGMQTFIVPPGVTSVTILAKGAQGANGANGGGNGFGGTGGLGSSAEGILNVTPGDVLNIFVGGQASGGTGGFNGGGNGGNLLAGGGGGASDVRLNSVLATNRVIVGAGGGGGGTGGCAVPNVNGGNGGHGNANGTNGIDSPNGGGGFAANGATGGAAGIGCGGFLGLPGQTAINEVGGNGGNGQGCCCASTPGGGGGGGGFIGGGGAGGGSAGTVGCTGNDKGGGGGGAGGSSFTGSLLSPVLVTGIQSGNGEVVITWTIPGSPCPSVRVAVTVTINPASPTPNPVTATPSTICEGATSQLNSTGAPGDVQSWYTVPSGGVAIGTSLSGVDFPVTPAVTTTYYAENMTQVVVGGTQTFSFTGGMQTFIVPPGVTSVTILAKGAQGANGANGGGNGFGGTGGLGSSAEGILNVTPGDVLNIFVGGQASGGTGGFNGGGNGGNLLAGGGGGASDVRLNSVLAANRVIVGAGGGGGGTGGCAVPNVNGGNGGHGNANGTNGIDSPNGGGGFAANGATGGAAGIGCGGFLGLPGQTAINEVGGNGGNGQGCCCASTPGGGGGGGGFIGGGGAGGGSAGTVGCTGNDKGGGGGGAGGSSFTGSLLSPVLVTGIQSGNGEVVLTWTGSGSSCPSVRVPVTVTVNPTPVINATATPSTTCNLTSVNPCATGAVSYVWTGGLSNCTPFVATTTDTYTVTGTDGAGCTGTSSVTVTVTPASGVLAPTTSNQTQDHGDDFNINYYAANCDLIATVDDGAGGNVLGLTTSTVNVDAIAGFHNGQPFVRRWYQITPTTNGSADVKLYINQTDFDDYNAAVVAPYLPLPTGPGDAAGIANIRITKNDDGGLGNNPIVITPAVSWNGTYWELSFNTPSFSQFRVHGVNPGNVPLPVTVTSFSGTKLESSDKLSWITSSEQNNAYFNLQHSTDGMSFSTIAKVSSKAPNGNSNTALSYTATNNKPALGHNYYRLQQVDIDNKVSVHAQIVDLIWGAKW